MGKDPVCGMDVDVDKVTATSTYQGHPYSFYAPGCKKAFDQEPTKYLAGQGESHGGHIH